jgi:murein DD-endopeptidase MepM/ murein hydrolase activator NlpD
MNFKIINPVKGQVPYPTGNRNFGSKRSGHKHEGIDIPVPSGSDVIAPADGEVVNSENLDNNNCGGFIKLKHTQEGTKFYTKYCHLKSLKVSKGDKVKAGDVIGLSGGGRNDPHKGSSSGAHLHFEIEDIAGNPYDPWPHLNKTYSKDDVSTSQEEIITTSTDSVKDEEEFDIKKTIDFIKTASKIFGL